MATSRTPTPVLVAGAAFFLLAGYVLGIALGSDSPARVTGVVQSFDRGTDELCLSGGSVASVAGADGDLVCGTWRRGADQPAPDLGDSFRFVSVRASDDPGGGEAAPVIIYGNVVGG